MKESIILGIETSCDDTSIALLKSDGIAIPEVIYATTFSQDKLLKQWGGVVPEIAARNHLAKIRPLIEETFCQSKISPRSIDLIGVTTHPGLLGPLLTGVNAAKTIALLFEKPILPVNHLYAHLEAIHLSEPVSYPYLGLLVSGGHSLYIIVNSSTSFEIIGSTVDDAAGEAFDKGAKLMGLEQPGGKIIDDLAKAGDKDKYQFPIGLKDSKDTRLSFSGVKTQLRQFMEQRNQEKLEDICASYQEAIINALAIKLDFAIKLFQEKTRIKSCPIVVGGGVACNSRLRTKLTTQFADVKFVLPRFCTDNGTMIANYALRTIDQAIPFPDCLSIDARGRFVKKEEMRGNNFAKSNRQ